LLIEEEENKIDWWTMYFNEAINVYWNGADIIIISQNKK
jgi:hypothetical protein